LVFTLLVTLNTGEGPLARKKPSIAACPSTGDGYAGP